MLSKLQVVKTSVILPFIAVGFAIISLAVGLAEAPLSLPPLICFDIGTEVGVVGIGGHTVQCTRGKSSSFLLVSVK